MQDYNTRPDGTNRNPAVSNVLKFFEYAHLPPSFRQVSEGIHDIAYMMADGLPENAELTVGLRKLLEAKDCFVRAALGPHC